MYPSLNSEFGMSGDVHFDLYHLNLKEMQPLFETEYEEYQLARAIRSGQRAQFESHFLKAIKRSQPFVTSFKHDIENMDATFASIVEYINSKTDNSYVNWFEGHASLENARHFVKEYGADQVYFTQYLSQLSIIAPERAAVEIFSNLYDETGVNASKADSYDFSQFHPEIFRRLCKYFSVSSVDRFHSNEVLNPETYYCINMMLLSIRLGYLCGAGAMFFTESSIPYQLGKVNSGMKRLGVPAHERQFFEMHCDLDEAHAFNWWNNGIKPYLKTDQDFINLMLGIDIAISARNHLWSGLHARTNT